MTTNADSSRSAIVIVNLGTPEAPTPKAVRRYLADDLDTPKAIAALDGWVTDAVEYGGHDAGAPKLVATAIDALLGVDL